MQKNKTLPNAQESVVPNGDTSVDPVDSNEAPDDEDPATVVNPAITVIQSPAIHIGPPSESRQTGPVMTGGKTTNSPESVTQSAGVGEMNEMNGRMKILEGQVKRLMEALEAENWFNWLVCLVVDS